MKVKLIMYNIEIMTKGKPMARRIITKVMVQSGKFNRGKTISTASRIMNAAVAYTTITWITFLRFSSCQNWASLLGIAMRLLTAIYGDRGYESN